LKREMATRIRRFYENQMTRLEIKFYGGVDEVGGNRISVEDGPSRVFLDYGMSFSRNQKFFEEYLKPRYASSGLRDLLRLHLIHNLTGIYRSDLLRLMEMKVHGEPSVNAVLLSHIHLDHSALISLLDERIPIICSETTQAYAKALLDVGTRSLETEVYNFKCRPLFNPRDEPIARQFKLLQSGKEMKIDDMAITPCSVDHSVLGATAYILRTSGGTIVYTGDLRFHGKLAKLSEKFAQTAANAEPDIMLCEGTRIHETENDTEDYVRKNAVKTIQGSKELVIADFAFRDLTRLSTFYEIAKETDRKLVISKKDAYLIEALSKASDLPFPLPSLKDKNILIYIDRKGTGTYRDKDYDIWERTYLEAANAVRAADIHEEEKQMMIHLTFFDINELIDIDPSPNAIYIHSASEPHNEEQVIDEQRLNNWLDYFEAKKHHYHASGHASGTDLRQLVEQVKPKTLMPIHTEHKELFKEFHKNVRMPTLQSF
jgi:ribonuclease J